MKSIIVRLFFSGVCLAGPVFSSPVALADQTAAELPSLFDELKDAKGASEATRIEGLIWQYWLEPPDADAAKLMTTISQAMGGADMAVALRYCDQLVETHPDYAEAWNKRATLHYMLGNHSQSVADIRSTVALEPRHFGAISGLGLIFLREQKFDDAIAAFEEVLTISPASANARRSIERLRQELGREI